MCLCVHLDAPTRVCIYIHAASFQRPTPSPGLSLNSSLIKYATHRWTARRCIDKRRVLLHEHATIPMKLSFAQFQCEPGFS